MIDVLQHMLNRGLQSWVTEDLTKESMEGMYEYVLKSVKELFGQSKQGFSESTMTWVAQQLFLTIKVKKQGDLDLGEDNLVPVHPVFELEPIDRIPNDQLRIIGGLLSDCDFAGDIAREIKRRHSWGR
jgi:hypothetical protein